ncbi:MAG: hypothetical protein WC755_04675 [Candidatus Woesearchaeota archaeon]
MTNNDKKPQIQEDIGEMIKRYESEAGAQRFLQQHNLSGGELYDKVSKAIDMYCLDHSNFYICRKMGSKKTPDEVKAEIHAKFVNCILEGIHRTIHFYSEDGNIPDIDDAIKMAVYETIKTKKWEKKVASNPYIKNLLENIDEMERIYDHNAHIDANFKRK